MRIKISKSQWQGMGKKAGWLPSDKNIDETINNLKESIKGLEIELQSKKAELKDLMDQVQRGYKYWEVDPE